MKFLTKGLNSIWYQVGLSALAYTVLLYFIPRQSFVQLFSLYSILFIGYYLIVKKIDLKQGVAIAIVFRCIALGSLPNLSDDFYRFLWDGDLWIQGINPYEFTPHFLMETESLNGSWWNELYEGLNSKNYYSVYPPLNQFLFASAVGISGTKSIWLSVVVLKLWIFLAELGTVLLLPKVLAAFGIKPINSLLYSLNPLVTIELCGNAHFEGVMIFFLVLFLWLWKRGKINLAALSFGAAVSVKLIPLMFLPLFFRPLRPLKWAWFVLIVGVVNFLLFLPFATPHFVTHFSSGLDLYFQSFQFNSFFFSILNDLLPSSAKPMASLITISFVLAALIWFSFSKTSMLKNLPSKMGMTLGFYYFFSAVVHPWYLSTVLFLNTFYPVRYIMAWSYLIGLSYFTYRTIPYEESAILIAFEYLIVFIVLFIDWIQLKRKRFSEE